jgi:basic membrane protein A
MYQGRYLSGVLAGMKTKSNVIGYVAAMPNAEVCRGINAFTLGVQRVNPNAKVLVMWTGGWQVEDVEAEHAQILIEKYGADLLTYHQDVDVTGQVAEKYGVDFIAYNAHLEGYSEHYLASVICRWDLYYKDILQKHMKGELFSIRDNWVGVQQGVITLSDYSESVTPKMLSVVNSAQNELLYNNNLIFCDEIYDNQGKLRCGKNQVIDDKELLRSIDWLVKGVEVVE